MASVYVPYPKGSFGITMSISLFRAAFFFFFICSAKLVLPSLKLGKLLTISICDFAGEHCLMMSWSFLVAASWSTGAIVYVCAYALCSGRFSLVDGTPPLVLCFILSYLRFLMPGMSVTVLNDFVAFSVFGSLFLSWFSYGFSSLDLNFFLAFSWITVFRYCKPTGKIDLTASASFSSGTSIIFKASCSSLASKWTSSYSEILTYLACRGGLASGLASPLISLSTSRKPMSASPG